MSFNFNYWAMLEPMKYYDKPDDSALSANLLKKKYDMIENKDNAFIASQKWDGEWTMFIKDGKDMLIRSRSLSKVTGEYGDKTESLPHLTEEMKNWPDGTVVLAEVCWPALGKCSTDVGSILRCKPEKAVFRQENEFGRLYAKVFDILCLEGESLLNTPYIERVKIIKKMFPQNSNNNNIYFAITNFFDDDFQTAADTIINSGGEGIVIQRKEYGYEPGKRTAWKTLKMKQKLDEMELKIISTKAPTKEYQGKELESWIYWEFDNGEKFLRTGENEDYFLSIKRNLKPISKAYYYNWKMGITVDFNGTYVDVSSGLADIDREWLATEEAEELIAKGQVYATIKSMMVASLGGLRHPVVQRIRVMDDAMLELVE